MDHRTLNKLFTVNRSLRLHRKSAGIKFTLGDIMILLSIYNLGRKDVGFLVLWEHLRAFNRTVSFKQLQVALERLSGYGVVEYVGGKSSLTVGGVNTLSVLEKRIRITRYDR